MNQILSTIRVYTCGPIPASAGYVRLSFGRVWTGSCDAPMGATHLGNSFHSTAKNVGDELSIT